MQEKNEGLSFGSVFSCSVFRCSRENIFSCFECFLFFSLWVLFNLLRSISNINSDSENENQIRKFENLEMALNQPQTNIFRACIFYP